MKNRETEGVKPPVSRFICFMTFFPSDSLKKTYFSYNIRETR